MADNKIILDVEIREEEALKALHELREQSAKLREEQKKLDTTTAEGQRAYAEYAQKIKAVNAAANEQSKIIQNGIKLQNQQRGSLNQMSKRLTELKNQYRDLSEEERNGEFGKGILAQTAALNQALKDAEEEYGVYTHNVGNMDKKSLLSLL